MGVLLSGLLSVFFSGLVGLSFVSCPVSCCLFLLVESLSLGGFVYFSSGVSWYVVLFCLIYVGGIFILVVYASVFDSSISMSFNLSYCGLLGLFIFLFILLSGLEFLGFVVWSDGSHFLCLCNSSFSYCFFCVVLLVGFSVVSLVSSTKDSFLR